MSKAKLANLYLGTFIVTLGVFAIGSVYSWTSPSIPKLRAKHSWLPVNTEEASWIGSLVAFGSIFGPFLGGSLVDHIGRRPTVIFSVVLGLISWIILYFTTTVWQIYISRVVGGIGGGIVFTVCPPYIAELATDDLRNALSSLFNLLFTGGLLVEYIVGPYVSYWTLVLVSCVPALVFLVASWWLPESPYYFLHKDQEEKAHEILSWLRKGVPSEQVTEEVKRVKKSIEEAKKSKGTYMDLFQTRGNRKALLLSFGGVAFQQLSGINVVLFYSETIFEMAGQSRLGPSEATILVACILMVAAAVAVPLTHRFGMKKMLLVSALGMSVFHAVMAVYLFLSSEGEDTSSYNWLPIVSLIGYSIIYSMGFGPLPYAITAEVFPPNVKGIGSALTTSTNWGMGFVLTKLFPIVAETAGMDTVFFGFSVFCIFAFLFVLILLPDTKGMSMQQIHDLLEGKPIESSLKTP